MPYRKANKFGATKPPPGTPINFGHHLSHGLRGSWLFNDGAGIKARAAGQSIYDGTLSNIASWSTGKYGTAFNPASTYQCALPVLNGGGTVARSFIAWIYPTNVTTVGNDAIFRYGTNTNLQGCSLWISASAAGQLYLGFQNCDFRTANAILLVNQWQQVGFSWIGGSVASTSNVKIWHNGRSMSLTKAGTGTAPNTTNSGYAIGYDPINAGREFPGKIDHAHFWVGRALTDTDARTLYHDPFAMYNSPARRIISAVPAAFTAVNRRTLSQRVGSRAA